MGVLELVEPAHDQEELLASAAGPAVPLGSGLGSQAARLGSGLGSQAARLGSGLGSQASPLGSRIGSQASPLSSRIGSQASPIWRASELADPAVAGGVDRLLPVSSELSALLPAGGLRRGSTVAVTPGISSLVLALLAEASRAGAWSAVVGMPGLGMLAAAQAGVMLERLALIPHPGPEWPAVVAALLDGLDVVVAAPPPGPVSSRVASRLAARARQRGSVLVPYGEWDRPDLTLTAERGAWEGLGAGRGRLRCRELTITARGRGAAARPRRVRVQLPDPTGQLAAASPPAGRPVLRVINGEAA